MEHYLFWLDYNTFPVFFLHFLLDEQLFICAIVSISFIKSPSLMEHYLSQPKHPWCKKVAAKN